MACARKLNPTSFVRLIKFLQCASSRARETPQAQIGTYTTLFCRKKAVFAFLKINSLERGFRYWLAFEVTNLRFVHDARNPQTTTCGGCEQRRKVQSILVSQPLFSPLRHHHLFLSISFSPALQSVVAVRKRNPLLQL